MKRFKLLVNDKEIMDFATYIEAKEYYDLMYLGEDFDILQLPLDVGDPKELDFSE